MFVGRVIALQEAAGLNRLRRVVASTGSVEGNHCYPTKKACRHGQSDNGQEYANVDRIATVVDRGGCHGCRGCLLFDSEFS